MLLSNISHICHIHAVEYRDLKYGHRITSNGIILVHISLISHFIDKLLRILPHRNTWRTSTLLFRRWYEQEMRAVTSTLYNASTRVLQGNVLRLTLASAVTVWTLCEVAFNYESRHCALSERHLANLSHNSS
jgi:hypothetical protein